MICYSNVYLKKFEYFIQLVAQKAGQEYADRSEETRQDTETMLTEYLAPEDEESDDDSASSVDGKL